MFMASVIVICNFDPVVTSLQEVVCHRFHSRQTKFVSCQQHRFDICMAMPVLAGSHGSECFGAFVSQCHCIRQWAELISILDFLDIEVLIVLMRVLSVFSHVFARDCMNIFGWRYAGTADPVCFVSRATDYLHVTRYLLSTSRS